MATTLRRWNAARAPVIRRICMRVGYVAAAVMLVLLAVEHFTDAAGLQASRRAAGALDRPPLLLWAWERPENLSFVDPAQAGVAFLAGTIRLTGERVEVRPRLPALIVPVEMTQIPVVRIESDPRHRPPLSARQQAQTLDAIGNLIPLPTAMRLQIDFDAVESERPFYRALLTGLRRRLPRAARLSMTALASWCLGDEWLDQLPVDEAVPMLFRMGADGNQVRQILTAGGDFRSPLCRHGVGISLDEPMPHRQAGRALYVFAPHAWSPASYHDALELARGTSP